MPWQAQANTKDDKGLLSKQASERGTKREHIVLGYRVSFRIKLEKKFDTYQDTEV